MNAEGLHIVAFDVPHPADYGGVIEIFYKIKSLHAAGVKIHLHVFEYGRSQAPELLSYCEKVYYYPRSGLQTVFSVRPYIVASRDSWPLLENLKTNTWPILFEGLHTCFFLNHRSLAKRKKLVRLHNVEHDYYAQLARRENNIGKRLYYKAEAIKLKWFESILSEAQHLLAISLNDYKYFKEKYTTTRVDLVNPWTNAEKVTTASGAGNYLLFHGNLSVQENAQAAMYLVQEVFSKIDFPFIIAGKNPSSALRDVVNQSAQGKLIANPEEEQMQELIAKAHINVLYSQQNTGIKLKLFNALYHGRYCVANDAILVGTSLQELVAVANTTTEIIGKIEYLILQDFTEEMIETRKSYLEIHYSNLRNTAQLLALIKN